MTENSTSGQIPVVDFGAFSVAHEEIPPATDPAAQDLVKRLYSACSSTGLVYLTNHGISQDEVDNTLQTMSTFFSMEPEVKSKWKKGQRNFKKNSCGWEEFLRQKENSKASHPDLKESFDITRYGRESFIYPGDDLIPGFKSTLKTFQNHLQQLSMRVLTALATGLDMSPEIFITTHEVSENTLLRVNYYPKVTKGIDAKPGQLRCGEHSDFSSITLLLQDDAGGLEVETEDGTFLPVTPIRGNVVLIFGSLMQRWTSDRLKAVVHRVVVPEEQAKREKERQSVVYFVFPNEDTTISCLDGSNKYPPVKAGQYVGDLIYKTYHY